MGLERLDPRIAMDASAPAILQVFEAQYETIENRAADIFAAGYGALWIPPTGRADSGGFSVGYDVYDRFDLGRPGSETLYGTEAKLKGLVSTLHDADLNVYADFIINHNGFADASTPGFVEGGGYPGFVLTLDGSSEHGGYSDVDGDFHGAFEGGDRNLRLSGLIDIAQEKDYQFVRHPVDATDPNNIPAGTFANRPDPDNARFYPDRDADPIFVFDPTTGESNIPIYPFVEGDPGGGDAVTENALGLLMRNAQWMIQTIGVDGFRVDAAKHVPQWVMNYFDRAVYRAIEEPRLDGSQEHAFSFSEVFSGDRGFNQSYIRKDIDPNDPGRVGGNRDVLDFPLFFALNANLTDNGFANDWRNIKNASQDVQDDGFANNGSQGVAFAVSHDEHGAYLDNVAHAFMLMRPGNAVVYFNAEQFGTQRDFPKDGRGDALGGLYGDSLTTLVNIRNTHGRGDYIDRTPGGDEKEMLIFERSGSAVTILSNRTDAGFDSRTVFTNFAPGTPLVELTGNAADPTIDPNNDFPEVVVVNGDGSINIRVPRNTSPAGVHHKSGYLIYGVSGPQTAVSISNVTQTLAPETPTASTNGTARLTPIDVIAADSFDVTVATNAVNHLGSIRDASADGDNALLKIDAGLDVNGSGGVDYVSPDGPVTGFEEFVTQKTPGWNAADGNGFYRQTVDATSLSEGMHFLETRAFRHREPGEGDAVYTSDRRTIYIDRLPPESAVVSFDPIVDGVNENRRAVIESVDGTADNVHAFLDLPAGLTDAEIIAMVGSGSQTNRVDRGRFEIDFTGVTNGNHVLTLVSFEPTGNVNVQRFAGFSTSTIFGAGIGDLDHDGDVAPDDMDLFASVYNSGGGAFHPAADVDGNGVIDIDDVSGMVRHLRSTGNVFATIDRLDDFIVADVPVDYGDAPDSYVTAQSTADRGPHHVLTLGGPRLGTSVDADSDGQPTAASDGDDGAGVDDEDGLVCIAALVPGQTVKATILVGGGGMLDAWVDFNGNGVFESSERIGGGSIPVSDGANEIDIDVPSGASVGLTTMRIRVSTDGVDLPTRVAADGEVEDHRVRIAGGATVDAVRPLSTPGSRSSVTGVEVEFDAAVDLASDPADVFTLRRVEDSAVVPTTVTSQLRDGRTVVRLDFVDSAAASGGSLADGRYELTLHAAGISSNGFTLDGDADGTAGDDFVFGDEAHEVFYRLYGDVVGDGVVDLLDFGRFRSTFGLASSDTDFEPSLDHDGDGEITLVDFGRFRSNFGV